MYPEVFFPKFWNFEIWPTYAKFSIFAIFLSTACRPHSFLSKMLNWGMGCPWSIAQRTLFKCIWKFEFWPTYGKFLLFDFVVQKVFFILVLKTNLDTYLPEKSPIYKTSIIWWHPKDPLIKRCLFREKES